MAHTFQAHQITNSKKLKNNLVILKIKFKDLIF